MRIPVSRLPFLLQIARSGGVLAAAEALRITPSAVSQQLARLEAEVGVPLAIRNPRGVTLTAAGRELIELAENIEREVNEAALRVGAASEIPSGLVRLGTFQSFVSGVLAQALPRWRTELAGVHLELIEADQPALLRGLRTSDFDVIIVERDETVAPAPLAAGTREIAILDDPWVLVTPAGTQAAMGLIEPEHLRLPWLAVDAGSGAFHATNRVRKQLSESVTAPHRYASHQTALSLVAAGEGVTLLPKMALGDPSLSGVEHHELPGLGVRHISLRFRPGRRTNAAVSAAVDFLRRIPTHSEGGQDQ